MQNIAGAAKRTGAYVSRVLYNHTSLVPQVFQAREAVPRAPAHKVGTRHAPRLRQRRVERCERLHLARLAERPG